MLTASTNDSNCIVYKKVISNITPRNLVFASYFEVVRLQTNLFDYLWGTFTLHGKFRSFKFIRRKYIRRLYKHIISLFITYLGKLVDNNTHNEIV